MNNIMDNEINEVKGAIGELLDTLISSTKEGSIKWEAMSIVNHYFVLLGNQAICIGRLSNDDEKIYYSVLDTKNEKTLFKLAFTPQDSLYKKLNDLYLLAQLDDGRIKRITDNLISELRNISGVNFSSIRDAASVAE